MRTKKIILISLLSSILIVGQVTLSFIPNVELVTLLLFIYTKQFGFKFSILVSIIFTTVMGIIWGFGTWVIMYYWIWPTLILLMALALKKLKSTDQYAFLLGSLALVFGALFALEPLLLRSPELAVIYFIKGIPFYIVHICSNYIVTLTLFEPINRIVETYKNQKFAF